MLIFCTFQLSTMTQLSHETPRYLLPGWGNLPSQFYVEIALLLWITFMCSKSSKCLTRNWWRQVPGFGWNQFLWWGSHGRAAFLFQACAILLHPCRIKILLSCLIQKLSRSYFCLKCGCILFLYQLDIDTEYLLHSFQVSIKLNRVQTSSWGKCLILQYIGWT